MLAGLSRRGGGLGWTNYKGKPQLQEEEDGDWGGGVTGGKDGNAAVEARRGNATTSCQ